MFSYNVLATVLGFCRKLDKTFPPVLTSPKLLLSFFVVGFDGVYFWGTLVQMMVYVLFFSVLNELITC